MGVALVASAAVALTHSTCKDRTTMVINAVAALVSFYYPQTWIFPALILAGGLVTLYTQRKNVRTSGLHSNPAAACSCDLLPLSSSMPLLT